MLSFVVAKSSNNVIGDDNSLPWYLPADLKHFKQITTGQNVVMGRKTFDSIIRSLGKPLPNRKNIVLTRQASFSYPGVDVIHTLDDVPSDAMVIGGGELYRQLIDKAGTLYVTEVHAVINGSVTFPDINLDKWREKSRESHTSDERNQYDFDFVTYVRN